MAMISTQVWGGRKTGATITGCTRDRDERQVMDRIVETGGRCFLVVDSRIGCLAKKPPRPECLSEDRRAAAWCAPVLDFRINRLSSGCHGGSKVWQRQRWWKAKRLGLSTSELEL